MADTWKSWHPTAYADVAPNPPDQYHNAAWHAQSLVYQEMWEYFDREIFDETLSNRQDDLKYPLGINLFETACANHRATLFGEFADDVLPFRVRSRNVDAGIVETAIDRIWRDSSRNSILLENGLLCSILGGAVKRVIWHPVHKKVYVRIVPADAFFPVWDPDDYHNLLEAFIAYQVDGMTAKRRFNVDVPDDQGLHLVSERWTPEVIEVTVGGEPAYWDRGHSFPMSGRNPYIDPLSQQGVIPIEYFPRDRAGSFYGIPLGKNALRMQDYYNEKAADLGDAVLEATHQYKFLRNRPGGTKGLERLTRTGLNNLGMGTPGKDAPEVFAIKGGDIPAGTVEWLNNVLMLARAAMHTPPVSYGVDEGSQRSALTLAFRMWPLSSAVRATRGYWIDNFRALHRKMIIVAATKGGYNLTSRHAEYDVLPVWAPMLPRDREGEVNEVVVRKANGLISVYHALELLEDRETEWIDEEQARIDADAKKEADTQVRIVEANQTQQQSGQGKPKPKPQSNSTAAS